MNAPFAAAATVEQRYARARDRLPAKWASRNGSAAVGGYWISDREFFFVRDEAHSCGVPRWTAWPMVADAQTCEVRPLLSSRAVDAIGKLLGKPLDQEQIAGARFDMPRAGTLIVAVAGREFQVDVATQDVAVLPEQSAVLRDGALYSPDGKTACFLRDHNVWSVDLATGAETRQTFDGIRGLTYGRSETGLAAVTSARSPQAMGLWSPDSEWFLTCRVDERALADMPLVQHVVAQGGRPELHQFKYVTPGDQLPVATYVALHVGSGRAAACADHPAAVLSAFSPFARHAWFDDAGRPWFLRWERHAREVELIRFSLDDGQGTVVIRERAEQGYIDLHPLMGHPPNVHVVPDTEEVVWYSERDGWGHLYLHDAISGALKHRITDGAFGVCDVLNVDSKSREIIFSATGLDPGTDRARRSICRVGMDGGPIEVVASGEGDVFAARSDAVRFQQGLRRRAQGSGGVSPDGRWLVARRTSVVDGDRTELIDRAGYARCALASTAPQQGGCRPVEVQAADGKTTLHGLLFLPSTFSEDEVYPVIDYIYPGPQCAHQPQSDVISHLSPARALSELGFAVVVLDTRGTGLGSREFRLAGYGSLLEPQLSDHAAAVRELVAKNRFLSGSGAGIFGSSGGGLAAARALCDYPDVYKAGVAAAGNYDPRLYLGPWSEKYLGPEASADAYAHEAVASVAHAMGGKLLLIAGETDENVHIAHTYALADALIRAGRDLDLLVVPNAGHDVVDVNGYVQRRIWDFFVTHLRDEKPPAGFEIAYTASELRRLGNVIQRAYA